MFNLLRRQKYDAKPLFEGALAASRNPLLYRDFGVPDTLDGRFDALLLHLWPLFRALEGEDRLSQTLYDLTFKRMELALRETGSGDLAVGRQTRAMMKAFYGRLVTYNGCTSDREWRDALTRNVYGTVQNVTVPDGMIAYAKALSGMQISIDDLKTGKVMFPTL
jgi:cytochrome b pre-mRNA-processing protein 3